MTINIIDLRRHADTATRLDKPIDVHPHELLALLDIAEAAAQQVLSNYGNSMNVLVDALTKVDLSHIQPIVRYPDRQAIDAFGITPDPSGIYLPNVRP